VLCCSYIYTILHKIQYLIEIPVSSQKLRAKGLQRGKAASYKIAFAILYIDIDWKKKPEARTDKISPCLLRSYRSQKYGIKAAGLISFDR